MKLELILATALLASTVDGVNTLTPQKPDFSSVYNYLDSLAILRQPLHHTFNPYKVFDSKVLSVAKRIHTEDTIYGVGIIVLESKAIVRDEVKTVFELQVVIPPHGYVTVTLPGSMGDESYYRGNTPEHQALYWRILEAYQHDLLFNPSQSGHPLLSPRIHSK